MGNMMSRRKLMTEKKISGKKANINIFNTEIKVNPGLEKLMRDSSIDGTRLMSNQESLKKQIRAGFGSLESDINHSAMDISISPDKSMEGNRRIKLPPVGSESDKRVMKKRKPAHLMINME